MRVTVLVALLLIAGATGAKGGACNFDSQVRALALNMYHEARNQGLQGMQLVGEVTLNRVRLDKFPNSICGVVYQPRQFSWTHLVKDPTPREQYPWLMARMIAWGLVEGSIPLYNMGATHYYNPKLVSRKPRWARQYEEVGTWKNHIFLRMDDL